MRCGAVNEMLRVLYWLLLVMAESWGYGNQILVGNGSALVKVSEIDNHLYGNVLN